MKRVFVALLGLLATALLVLPWYAGVQARAHYDRILAQLEQQGVRVVHNHYRQGWFGSEAVTELDLRPATAEPSWPVRAESRIQHGPLPLDGLADGGPLWARIFSRISTPLGRAIQGPPLQADTRVDLDGGLETAVRMADHAGDGFQVEGLDGHFRFAAAGGLRGTLQVPRLALEEADDSALQLRDLDLSVDLTQGAGRMQLGRATFELGALRLDDPQADVPLSLQGLRVAVDSGAEGELVYLSTDYRVRRLVVAGEEYADAGMRIVVERLPAPVLARMREALDRLEQQQMSEAQRGFAAMGVLAGNLQALLADNPRLGLERLHLVTPAGLVEGRVVLQLRDPPAAALINPMLLLGHLDGEAELALPETLLRSMLAAQMRDAVRLELEKQRLVNAETRVPDELELQTRIDRQVEQQIQRLLRQELAIRDGERIRSRARLSGGLLTVNGKTIPLPMLGLLP